MRAEQLDSPVWPYSERDAVLADIAMQALQAPAEAGEAVLQRAELFAFAQNLYTAPAEIADKYADLEAVTKIPTEANAKTLYADYFFETEEGRVALDRLGVAGVTNPKSLYVALSARVAEGTVIDKKAKLETSNESGEWYRKKLAAGLESEEAAAAWQDGSIVYINYGPESLLKKFEAYQAYRDKYRELRLQLQDEAPSELRDNKRRLLAIHWAKVNELTASLYPSMVHFAEQLKVSPDTEKSREWSLRLMDAVPVAKYLFKEMDGDIVDQSGDFLRRLDFIRNGAEQFGGPDFTPIADADVELAALMEQGGDQTLDESVERLPGEIVAELDGKEWKKEDLQQLLEGVLAKWGILSDTPILEESEFKERSSYAADGKWQIVFAGGGDSLSVNGKKRVMVIAKSFARSGSEALALAAHELDHVVQNAQDEKLAEQIPLAKVGGRRRSAGREMGGIYEERRLKAMLGKLRPTNTTYLRALQAKLDGGNQLRVADAFYQAGAKPNAAMAADRALRLYRYGGYNSQPIDYLEQELLLQSMSGLQPEEVRVLTSSITTFSFKDAATLHVMGLLEIPDHVEQQPAEDVMSVFKAQRLAKISA